MVLLCKFIHRQRQPDLETLDWQEFVKLAAAVEKYGVFAAMEVCKMKMRYYSRFAPSTLVRH